MSCLDPDCRFCHTPQDWTGPIKTTPVKMVTGAKVAESLKLLAEREAHLFKSAFHMSTGEGAGPDSLGEQRPRMKQEHPEKIEDTLFVFNSHREKMAEQKEAFLNSVIPAKAAPLTEEVLEKALEQANDAGDLVAKPKGTVGVVDLTDKDVRVLHVEGVMECRGWSSAQGVAWIDTGCFKCADGVDYNDPFFRCLEHRKERKSVHQGFEWDTWKGGLIPTTKGIAALELPDPQDSIEGKHQRAARRWGAVKASYRRR